MHKYIISKAKQYFEKYIPKKVMKTHAISYVNSCKSTEFTCVSVFSFHGPPSTERARTIKDFYCSDQVTFPRSVLPAPMIGVGPYTLKMVAGSAWT